MCENEAGKGYGRERRSGLDDNDDDDDGDVMMIQSEKLQ